ncbi:hypothetical protein KEM56_004571 [Ascosphaera pollenicola]|nr:hypothetical protein KEM56_004571 [Ascosphaera pollenicola]
MSGVSDSIPPDPTHSSVDSPILRAPTDDPTDKAASSTNEMTSNGFWKSLSKMSLIRRRGDADCDKGPIFGVPLAESVRYASVVISVTDDAGETYVYGVVPIVVAKCGLFLKEEATTTKGIFRVSGSAKRIRVLQAIFSKPNSFGKKLDWKGYSVHDAANILRRYLLLLPEPIVPLDFYFRFRDPFIEEKHYDLPTKVHVCQELIKALPPLNRQLLLYILDLLAVFAAKCEENLMTAGNLAAIFQPALLSHPVHIMQPEEYLLSQMAIVFLIENQDHFLFGMSGTGIDEATWKEIHASQNPDYEPQSATPAQLALPAPSEPPTQSVKARVDNQSKAQPINTTPGTPYAADPMPQNQFKKGGFSIRRTASVTSSGAESARKREALLRRNKSVASSQPRSANHSPQQMSPQLNATGNLPKRSGSFKLGFPRRSNTVPSKRKGKEGTVSPHMPTYSTPPVPSVPPLATLPQKAVMGGNAPMNNASTPNEVTRPSVRMVTTGTSPTVEAGPKNDKEIDTSYAHKPTNSKVATGIDPPAVVSSPPVRPQQSQSPDHKNQFASPPVSPRESLGEPGPYFANRRSMQQIRPQSPERPGTPPQETSKLSSILHALSPPRFAENRQSRKERRAPNRLRKLQSPSSPESSASVPAGGHARMASVKHSQRSQEPLSPTTVPVPSGIPPRDSLQKEADMAIDAPSQGEGYHSSRSDDVSRESTSRPSSNSRRNEGSGSKEDGSSFGTVFQKRSKK